jgi:hypothetical protein
MSINVDRIVALAETVEVVDETEGYTGYGIAKVINDTLKQLGVAAEVTPHAVYNDSRNGRIDGVKHVAGEKVRYTEEQVTLYAAKFVAKRVGRTTNAAEEPNGWEESDVDQAQEIVDADDLNENDAS